MSASENTLSRLRRRDKRVYTGSALEEGNVSGEPPFYILAGTWNVAGGSPIATPDIRDWLCPSVVRSPVDLYVIGLQEAQSLTGVDAVRTDREKGKLWERKLRNCVGEDYDLVILRQLTGIVLVIFLHQRHRNAISGLDCSYAATGFLNQGNKGGVVARFVIYNRSVACVVAHLSADDDKVERRKEDFCEINRKAVFTPNGTFVSQSDELAGAQESSDSLRKNLSDLLSSDFRNIGQSHRVSSMAAAAANILADLKEGADTKAIDDPDRIHIQDHDIVVWLGDLNYRIDAAPETVVQWVNVENWPALQAADQLNKERNAGHCFSGYREAPITFAPTYKVSKFRNEYGRDENGDLKRTPSYTDRVLWCTKSEPGHFGHATDKPAHVRALVYNSAPVLSSDHRPVYALLDVRFGTRNRYTLSPVTSRRPALEGHVYIDFSETDLDFGEVPLNLKMSKTITVKNRSHNEARIVFPACDELPAWLTVTSREDENQKLKAHGTKEITFEIQLFKDERLIDNGVIEKLLTTSAHILVEPMLVKHSMEIKVKPRNSCYGMPLHDLILHKSPLAFCDLLTVESSSSSLSSDSDVPSNNLSHAPLSVPKEVWLLTDVLFEGRRSRKHRCHYGAKVFLHSASTEAWIEVLTALDYGNPVRVDMEETAVATCLIELLRGLPEPTLPREAYAGAMAAAQKRNGNALRRVLCRLPDVSSNFLFYILSFLAEMALAWSPAEQVKVATVFAKTGLLGRPSKSQERISERSNFILFVMDEYATGRFSSQNVFDLTGCDISPSERQQSRSRRWKRRAGRKMKKVFG